MFKPIAAALLFFSLTAPSSAAILVIDRDSTVIDGGTYEYMQTCSGHRYITIRNASFINTIPANGTNPEGGLFFTGCRYVTVENCLIDGQFNSCRGVRLDGCSNVEITGNEIRNLNDDGIRVESCSRVNITDNVIRNLFGCGTDGVKGGCSCNNGHSDGIQVISVTKMQIHRNLIYGNTGTSGIMLGADIDWPVRDVQVTNNLVHTPKAASACYMRQGIIDVQFYNNTFLGGVYFSCWFEKAQPLTDLEIVNNIFTHPWTWQIPYDSTAHYIHNNIMKRDVVSGTYPLPADNMLQTDPGLANMPGDNDTTGITTADFELAAGSPCINAGLDRTGIPATDYFGNGRNGGTDMGGIEFDGIVSGIRDRYSAAARMDGAVSASPQPMAGQIYFIEHRDGMEHDLCTVYDHTGRPVARPGTGRTWDGTDLSGRPAAPGIYYYSFTGRTGIVTGRIVKAE